jgi:hypothetical protein
VGTGCCMQQQQQLSWGQAVTQAAAAHLRVPADDPRPPAC